MALYVVYRHGHNEMNQSAAKGLPGKMAVARVEAADADEACRLARRDVSLAPSQRLTAEPADPVDAHEEDLNRTAEAIARGAEDQGTTV